MDTRTKSGYTGSGKWLGCLGCRRRSNWTKVSPIVVQVFIVVTVWVIVNHYCSSSAADSDDGIKIRSIKSASDQAASLCNNGEYVQGTSLRIKDIISDSGSSEEDNQLFLQVDMLVHSSEDGIPTLYAAGTPVVLDGIANKKKSGKMTEEEKAEFYYDNSLEERDLDEHPPDADKSNLGNDESLVPFVKANSHLLSNGIDGMNKDHDQTGETDLMKKNIENKNNTRQDYNMDSVAAVAGGSKTFQNQNILQQNAKQVDEQINHPSLQNGLFQETRPLQNQDFVQQNAKQPVDLINSQLLQTGQSKETLSLQPRQMEFIGMQNQRMPAQSDLKFVPQRVDTDQQVQQQDARLREFNQNNKDQTMDDVGGLQDSKQIENGIRSHSNGNNGDIMEEANYQNEGVPVNSEYPVETNIAQFGSNQDVYNESFKERLMRFKTEFYGREVDASSSHIPTTYAINNPNICDYDGNIDVLFLVNSIPQSNEQRQLIRGTFVDASLFQSFTIAHVFMVAQTTSPNFQGNLDKEHEIYGDIVQGEFMDKPETQTYKGLMSFQWVKTFCQKARFVMKLDEGVFVDTDKLLQSLLPALTNVIGERAMLCFFVQNAPIPRSGPNAIDPNVFPKSSRMRPHCKGFAILMTSNTILSLLAAAEHVPMFHFEELFLYGILPFIAGEIEVYDLGNKRAFHDFGKTVVNCYQDLSEKCPFVATKAFSSRFTSMWEFVTARKTASSQYIGDPYLWNIKEYQSSFYA